MLNANAKLGFTALEGAYNAGTGFEPHGTPMKPQRVKNKRALRFQIVAHLSAILIACFGRAFAEPSPANSDYELKPINLPGATGPVALDYFAYDRATGKLWVPASNTGSVDVIDEATDAVAQITGFKTGEVELRGRKVIVGPTAISIGDGVVYIGNRGDSTLCVIDAHTLERGECLEVAPISAGRAAAADGVVYVAATRELWITT